MKKMLLKLSVLFAVLAAAARADVNYHNDTGSPQTITIRKDTFSESLVETVTVWEDYGAWEIDHQWPPYTFDAGAWYFTGVNADVHTDNNHSDETWDETIEPGGTSDHGDASFSDSSHTTTHSSGGIYSYIAYFDAVGFLIGYDSSWEEYSSTTDTWTQTVGYYVHTWW